MSSSLNDATYDFAGGEPSPDNIGKEQAIVSLRLSRRRRRRVSFTLIGDIWEMRSGVSRTKMEQPCPADNRLGDARSRPGQQCSD
ncbi:MAG TPA: hypothetical protein VNF99_21240, partial [Stellaceae bacterium]|nr:hypothetical protein [Stellaceae bacterium]